MAPVLIVEDGAYKEGIKWLNKNHRWEIVDRLNQIVLELAEHKITTQYKNHALSGLKAYELHVTGDVLLIYRYKNQGTELEFLNLIDLTDHKTLKNAAYQKQLKKKLKDSLESSSIWEYDIDEEGELLRDGWTRPKK